MTVHKGGQSRDKNQFLCTSIQWTETDSESAISFLKLIEISRGKVYISRNLLYNCQINVLYNLLDSSGQLDLYCNVEVAGVYI